MAPLVLRQRREQRFAQGVVLDSCLLCFALLLLCCCGPLALQLVHRNEEKRLLISQLCPGIAPHVPKSTRDGLLLSLMLGAAEDPAALVREAAAMHLAHLLPALDDLSVYPKVSTASTPSSQPWHCHPWQGALRYCVTLYCRSRRGPGFSVLDGRMQRRGSKGGFQAHSGTPQSSTIPQIQAGRWGTLAAACGVVHAQIERVVFQLVCDSDGVVVDEALQTLVPAFVTWSISRKHPFGKVLRAVMQRMRAEVDKCPPLVPPTAANAKRAEGHMRSLGEREKWNFGVLLRMLTGLLGEVSLNLVPPCISSASPGALTQPGRSEPAASSVDTRWGTA